MPSFTALAFALGLLYLSVFLTATTYRNVRFGNEHYPHPFPFRYALASAAVETFLTPPLAQHRARMKAMRQAEARRTKAVALSMGRHPAGTQGRMSALVEPSVAPQKAAAAGVSEDDDQFVARVRATHVADQVTASFRAAKDRHPATRATRAAAQAAHAPVAAG